MGKPKIIAVVGANASGKSALGVRLARAFSGEIVSADSRQVFKGLDLGSGKITKEDAQGIPHHLIDVCPPNAFYSMADFQRQAYAAIDDIRARGKTPFLVGGTGLYIASVTEGYLLSDRAPDLALREELETYDTPALYDMLVAREPGTEIDPKNRNRVMRRLEKLAAGDTEPPASARRYDVLKLGVRWEREALKARIDERLKARMDAGMVDEVRALIKNGASVEFLMKLGLEYRFITQYINGEFASEHEMTEKLAEAIKRFAKRQITWFKRDNEILWLDMNADPFAQATEAIQEFLKEDACVWN